MTCLLARIPIRDSFTALRTGNGKQFDHLVYRRLTDHIPTTYRPCTDHFYWTHTDQINMITITLRMGSNRKVWTCHTNSNRWSFHRLTCWCRELVRSLEDLWGFGNLWVRLNVCYSVVSLWGCWTSEPVVLPSVTFLIYSWTNFGGLI